MPRCDALSPRQIFPPPITTATCTPMSWISLICRHTSLTISGEILSELPFAFSASPLSLRMMRLYLGFWFFEAGARFLGFGIGAQMEHETFCAWKGKCRGGDRNSFELSSGRGVEGNDDA